MTSTDETTKKQTTGIRNIFPLILL